MVELCRSLGLEDEGMLMCLGSVQIGVNSVVQTAPSAAWIDLHGFLTCSFCLAALQVC